MKTEVTKRDTSATLKISLDQPALAPFHRQTLDTLRPRVKAAGFRPGKAPDNIVERELGSAAIQNEVLETAVRHAYAQAVTEQELPVVAPPEVQVTKYVPYDELEFTATVDVLGTIEVADFRRFKLDRPKVEVAAAEVDQVVEDLRRRMANRQSVDRPARLGDELNIDFEGSRDGAPVEGAASKSYDLLLGSGSFIPGFEEQLVGTETGGSKSFDLTFPADYSAAELAGQTVTFKVTINRISQVDLPEVNADFVHQVSQHASLDELKADIKARITAEKTGQADHQFEQQVLEELVKRSQLQVPAGLVDQQLERLRSELGERLASSGLDVDKYLKMTGKTATQLEQELRPEAEKRVALALTLTEVAKQEELKVDDAEIEAELARLRQTYTDRQMQQELSQPEVREDIYNHLLASKTVARILELLPR